MGHSFASCRAQTLFMNLSFGPHPNLGHGPQHGAIPPKVEGVFLFSIKEADIIFREVGAR